MTEPALDFHALVEAGIQHLEQLAPGQWTDFNAHDPGITILEQVAWALTDLGYRLDHPIEDILAESADPGVPAPSEVLGSAPVTLDDMRRAVLDIPGVENVWIEPDPTPDPKLFYSPIRSTLSTDDRPEDAVQLQLKGLWHVRVVGRELEDGSRGSLRSRIAQRLMAMRPLGQDFSQIDVLPPEKIHVDADIEMGPGIDAEALLERIADVLDQHISPRAHFDSVHDRMAQGGALEQIYDGPVLDHGVLRIDTLPPQDRPSELHASDLLCVLMDVPGVRAVRHLRMASSGVTGQDNQIVWHDWVIQLDPGRAPVLEMLPGQIRLRREQVPVRTDHTRVQARRQITELADRAMSTTELGMQSDPKAPVGQSRSINDYQSILHQFPGAYGIGVDGLPASAPPEHRGQMLQLKAFLQIFDQMLADRFAQAANAADLLSGSSETIQLYRPGEVGDDGLHLDVVRRDPENYQTNHDTRTAQASASPHAVELRRRQFDHLLARHGEAFVDPLPMASTTIQHDGIWDGLKDRQALLSRIVPIARRRGTAANDLTSPGPENLSGLEERIALKSCLRPDDGETFFMVEHLLLRMTPEDQAQTEPLLTAAASADPFSMQISFVFAGSQGRFNAGEDDADAGFRELVEHLVREETPAHLTPYVHWLGDRAYRGAEAHFARWRAMRRSSLETRYGLASRETGP